jgi:putative lipoic acid-binding regulatory protein
VSPEGLVIRMIDADSCLQFPCEFPVKVVGLNTGAFDAAVTAIFEKHVGPDPISYSRRPSSSNKYLSITATFMARGRGQVDALYQELNDHDLVVMTL